jgi:hypothetical protein
MRRRPLVFDSTEQAKYRFVPGAHFPLGKSTELVYSLQHRTAAILSESEAALLKSCTDFASITDHTRRLCAELPALAAKATSLLEFFTAQGALLLHSDLYRCETQVDPMGQPRVSWMALPTSRRPIQLARALDSYRDNFSLYSRQIRFVIADDCGAAEQANGAEQLISSIRSRFPSSVDYLGPKEKRRLVSSLARKGALPLDVLEFGLLGSERHSPTTGANRNCILLHTAGDMLLCADDDTVCRPVKATRDITTSHIRFGSDGDPTELWFFPDRECADRQTVPIDMDVLSAHEELLGRKVRGLLLQQDPSSLSELDGACAHILQSIWSGRGEVLITLNGSAGDSGLHSSRGLPLITDIALRERLLKTPETYRMALSSREIIREVRAKTVCHSSPFMSMFMGMDNRSLLPPFFPVYRGQDSVFGCVLGRCYGDAYFGYLPWSLTHEPPSGRSYADIAGGRAVRVSELVSACIAGWAGPAHPAVPPAACVESLGRYLSEVGSLSLADFHEFIRIAIWRQTSEWIAQIELLLKRFGSNPSFWAEDLKSRGESLQSGVENYEFPLPTDLQRGFSKEEALQETRELIGQYGRLLEWWPAIVHDARKLRQ